MVTVKICGVRTVETARAASIADFVGLNFVAGRRRAVTPEFARTLDTGAAKRVGVFIEPTAEEVRRAAQIAGFEGVQLHGQETAELCRELSKDFFVIKAIAVSQGLDTNALAAYRPYIRAFLFDAPSTGDGRTFDWMLLADAPRPFFLAGGLNAENVEEAIRIVRPDGVDTASGAEFAGTPSPERIQAFIAAAKGVV